MRYVIVVRTFDKAKTRRYENVENRFPRMSRFDRKPQSFGSGGEGGEGSDVVDAYRVVVGTREIVNNFQKRKKKRLGDLARSFARFLPRKRIGEYFYLFFSNVIHRSLSARRWNRRRRRWRWGDVVFNVRLGVCLCSFPPYITLYDPYRTALASPPRFPPPFPSPPPLGPLSPSSPTVNPRDPHRYLLRRRNENIICQKPPPKTTPFFECVVGREISRNSKSANRHDFHYCNYCTT